MQCMQTSLTYFRPWSDLQGRVGEKFKRLSDNLLAGINHMQANCDIYHRGVIKFAIKKNPKLLRLPKLKLFFYLFRVTEISNIVFTFEWLLILVSVFLQGLYCTSFYFHKIWNHEWRQNKAERGISEEDHRSERSWWLPSQQSRRRRRQWPHVPHQPWPLPALF